MTSLRGWPTAFACCAPGSGSPTRGTRRCTRRSTGVTTCSLTMRAHFSRSCPSSPAGSPSKPSPRPAMERLDDDRDYLHAAVHWALERESDLALPLCAALWRYWLIRGFRDQGREWLERALALPAAAPPPVRAIALGGAALFARLNGDF